MTEKFKGLSEFLHLTTKNHGAEAVLWMSLADFSAEFKLSTDEGCAALKSLGFSSEIVCGNAYGQNPDTSLGFLFSRDADRIDYVISGMLDFTEIKRSLENAQWDSKTVNL